MLSSKTWHSHLLSPLYWEDSAHIACVMLRAYALETMPLLSIVLNLDLSKFSIATQVSKFIHCTLFMCFVLVQIAGCHEIYYTVLKQDLFTELILFCVRQGVEL